MKERKGKREEEREGPIFYKEKEAGLLDAPVDGRKKKKKEEVVPLSLPYEERKKGGETLFFFYSFVREEEERQDSTPISKAKGKRKKKGILRSLAREEEGKISANPPPYWDGWMGRRAKIQSLFSFLYFYLQEKGEKKGKKKEKSYWECVFRYFSLLAAREAGKR